MKIDVSIIILSFNTRKMTVACVDSVYRHTKSVNFELILIDNASIDDSATYLEKYEKHANFTLIKNSKNIGFGRANSLGIDRSKGKYVLLLNSDTLLLEDSVSETIYFMDKTPGAGIASCKLLNPDKSAQSSGGYFPTLPRIGLWMSFVDDLPIIKNHVRSFHPDPFQFSKPTQVDWVMGSFFMIDRKVIEKIGKFDKDYFMYTEEVDYCYRVKTAGFGVWYVPSTSLIHYGGASSGAGFAIQNEFKGITTFYAKHKSRAQQIILKALLAAGITMRMVVFGLVSGKDKFIIYKDSLKYI